MCSSSTSPFLEAQRDDAIKLLDKADAELIAEKQKSTGMEKEIAARKSTIAELRASKRHGETTVKILLYFFKREGTSTPQAGAEHRQIPFGHS
jgi:hypothetical protein